MKIEDGLKTIIVLYAENLNIEFGLVLRYFERERELRENKKQLADTERNFEINFLHLNH